MFYASAVLEANRTSYPRRSRDSGKKEHLRKFPVFGQMKTEGLPDGIAERLLQIALLYISGHVVPVSALLILDFIYA